MVKGISKRVVVVKNPDTRFFDQAIFLLKEDALSQKGVSQERLLEEACRVADGYARAAKSQRPRRGFRPLLWALAGGSLVGVAWLLTALLI